MLFIVAVYTRVSNDFFLQIFHFDKVVSTYLNFLEIIDRILF